MGGVDLLSTDIERRQAITGECFTHNAVDLNDPSANLRWRWIIEGDWKLIVPEARNEPNAKIELLNLTVDPHEAHDVAKENSNRVMSLRGKLDAWWNPDAP